MPKVIFRRETRIPENTLSERIIMQSVKNDKLIKCFKGQTSKNVQCLFYRAVGIIFFYRYFMNIRICLTFNSLKLKVKFLVTTDFQYKL